MKKAIVIVSILCFLVLISACKSVENNTADSVVTSSQTVDTSSKNSSQEPIKEADLSSETPSSSKESSVNKETTSSTSSKKNNVTSSNNTQEKSAGWPINDYTSGIPKYPGGIVSNPNIQNSKCEFTIKNVSYDNAFEYIKAIEAAGFITTVNDVMMFDGVGAAITYSGNKDGKLLDVLFASKMLTIKITK